MPRPITSVHKFRTLKLHNVVSIFTRQRNGNKAYPNDDRIVAPGTSMSRPYLWSINVRYRTSFTIKLSNP